MKEVIDLERKQRKINQIWYLAAKAQFASANLRVSSLSRMALPLPLAHLLIQNLIWKWYFDSNVFRGAANNQRMGSDFPCMDPISMGTWCSLEVRMPTVICSPHKFIICNRVLTSFSIFILFWLHGSCNYDTFIEGCMCNSTICNSGLMVKIDYDISLLF